MRRFALASAVLGLMVGVAGQATADELTIYMDKSAFDAAATILDTLDFEGIAPQGSFLSFGSNFTQMGVTFTDTQSRILIIDGDFPQWGYQSSSGAYLNENAISPLDIYLPGNITAVGFNVAGLGPPIRDPMTTVRVTTSGVETSFAIPGASLPDLAFVGVTSDAPITKIEISNFMPVVDNFSFGDAGSLTAVPEPSAVAMIVTGLPLGMGFWWWMRRIAIV